MKKTAIFGLAIASPLAGTAVPKAAVNAGSCVDPGGRQLSRPHYPDPSAECYTAEGAEGSGRSNLTGNSGCKPCHLVSAGQSSDVRQKVALNWHSKPKQDGVPVCG